MGGVMRIICSVCKGSPRPWTCPWCNGEGTVAHVYPPTCEEGRRIVESVIPTTPTLRRSRWKTDVMDVLNFFLIISALLLIILGIIVGPTFLWGE